ncbi:MAG: Gfo/Idh/MocA family oxidoreductase [Clostridia bacterium]|nr:Gfo/Idh/MocA family oxidoreductase [Clostridia bacterium]
MFRLGIAGFRHGHIYSLYDTAQKNERIETVAFWEENAEAALGAEKSRNIVFTHNSYQDMLKDPDIDIIGIGNYYGARGSMAIEALKAGKHVIADKPLCTSLEELDEIKKISEEKGLSVGLMLDLRHHKNVLAAKKVIADGTLGEIHNIQFGGQHPLLYGERPSWYFEKGKHGGVINDIAIHGVDLISYLTGYYVDKIIGARTWNAYATEESDFKDCGQFMLSLSNGAGVIADISYSVPNSIGFNIPYYWEFKIWGSHGMLAFSANADGVKLYLDGEKEVLNIPAIEPKDNYLDAFLDEIEGKKSSLISSEEIFNSSKTTLLIQKCADESIG